MIIDQNGNVLTSRMQSELIQLQDPINVNTQIQVHSKIFYSDILAIKRNHPTAIYLAIRQYANRQLVHNHNGQYTGTLNMVPINNASMYRESVHKKYGAPIGDVILTEMRTRVWCNIAASIGLPLLLKAFS